MPDTVSTPRGSDIPTSVPMATSTAAPPRAPRISDAWNVSVKLVLMSMRDEPSKSKTILAAKLMMDRGGW